MQATHKKANFQKKNKTKEIFHARKPTIFWELQWQNEFENNFITTELRILWAVSNTLVGV